MRVKICTLNVGGGVGNRTVGMEMFSFVDVFFIVDPTIGVGRSFISGEGNGFDLFSFCKGSGVEVFVRREVVGLFSLVWHDDFMVVLEYRNERGERKRLGGVYLRPFD